MEELAGTGCSVPWPHAQAYTSRLVLVVEPQLGLTSCNAPSRHARACRLPLAREWEPALAACNGPLRHVQVCT